MPGFLPLRVRHRRHALLLVACGLLAIALPLGLSALLPEKLERLELWSVDLRFQIRPPLPKSDQIVVIDYDDEAVLSYGLGRWPWDRRVHAELLDWLKAGEAKAVLIDLLFDRPAAPAEDEALRGAMQRAGMVVLPALVHPIMEEDSKVVATADTARFFLHSSVSGVGRLPGLGGMIWPVAPLREASAGVGHIQRTTDADGVLRRIPLVYASREGVLPALGLAAALRYLDADLASLRIERGRALTFAAKDGHTVSLPLDAQGRTWINYAGPWGQRFAHYPYSWLREQIEQGDGREHLTEWFRGKAVILANLTTGSGDLGPTPFERDFPFGEVHAHLLNMILTQQTLRDDGPVQRVGATVLPVAVLTAAALGGGPGLLLPAFGVLALGLAFAAQQSFAVGGVIMPVVLPMLSLSLALVLLLAARFFIVDRERLRFLSMLGGLVPAHTIRAVEASPERIPHLLAGRRKELTMVFVDMQGFTEFCQKADPLEIQRVLKEYRTVVTGTLKAHGGTLEKYTGDEVMAFFGDADPDGGTDEEVEARVARQAANAVRAGLAIQQQMAALNDRWQAQGRTRHLLRIGINTGPVTVGNFGTAHLWQYGVVGPEVNKGKRLEGAAEPGGILLSRRTYALAWQQRVLPADLPVTTAVLKGFGEESESYPVSSAMVAELAKGQDCGVFLRQGVL